MIHTEVDLPTDVYENVERIAQASHSQPSQVLRDLITRAVQTSRQPIPRGRGLGALADLGIEGPNDLGSRLDEYLYGDE
jgi:hypothetical protein